MDHRKRPEVHRGDAHKDKPFFLYFATTLPHSPSMLQSLKADPRVSPCGYLAKAPAHAQPSRKSVFERIAKAGLDAERAAGFLWLDDGVGAILKKLAETGVAEHLDRLL